MTDQINTNTNDDMFLSFWLDDNEVTNVADTDMNMNASVSKPSSKSKSSTSTKATKKEDDGRPRRTAGAACRVLVMLLRMCIMRCEDISYK
jgi:hypothetical protein